MADKLANCMRVNPDAACRIFCFPWAGGGSIFYAKWGSKVPADIEVCSLRYPGRENRFREQSYTSQTALVNDITTNLLPLFKEKPFVFFGHSLGAVVSFEVARNLKEMYGIEPKHLVVSGANAPHSVKWKDHPARSCSQMGDDEFIAYLGKLGGTPKEVLQNREMMKIFLPSLRADYGIIEKYEYTLPESGSQLICPVSVVNGSEDRAKDIDAWSEVTTGPFKKQILPGGHFHFIGNSANEEQLLKFITDSCIN
ncbi:S-acyl fatty acid synthase thioesterase, medium chain-like [Lineus longissimus]|uniref:S-acyl fatty acid synthase thioesterase, medium chain-like n=1 Tax=Lineus longissimus TaxID=88925 RepID=UPI002B4F76A5